MLSTDQLRFSTTGGEIQPSLLPHSPGHLAKAQTLMGLFSDNVGRSRGELQEAIDEEVGNTTQIKIWRGLAKLLADRSEFTVAAAQEPSLLRARVFEVAAASFPLARNPTPLGTKTRAEVLAEVAAELSLSADELDRALYADLERAHRLVSFDALSPEALLNRYNVALCQGILCHATELVARVSTANPKQLRQLFRYLKFFQLMYRARQIDAQSLELTVDGPASLLRLSKKYGLQLAQFFPALLGCDRWELTATVLWKRRRRRFTLSQQSALQSTYRETGCWISREEQELVQRIEARHPQWEVVRDVTLLTLDDQQLLIPDFQLRHRESGREAAVEIVGFWRRGYLKSKFELLKRGAPKNLLLIVSQQFNTEKQTLKTLPAAVLFFKRTILVDEVIARAEAIAAPCGKT